MKKMPFNFFKVHALNFSVLVLPFPNSKTTKYQSYSKKRNALMVNVNLKKKHVSSPRPLHFLVPPLFFYNFYEQRFYEQKPTGVTCKAHCCKLGG